MLVGTTLTDLPSITAQTVEEHGWLMPGCGWRLRMRNDTKSGEFAAGRRLGGGLEPALTGCHFRSDSSVFVWACGENLAGRSSASVTRLCHSMLVLYERQSTAW